LRQTLYAIRRDLDPQVLIVGTTELRLNPQVLTCDLVEFETARAAGDHETAAALYRGPFLDGFHLPGAAEFDQWVDGERRRIDDSARSSLEALATAAERREDFAAAVASWRRLAALDPYNSRVALGLMRSLAASGDPGGAVRHAQVHQALVREELGSDPDPAFLAFTARLVNGRSATTQPAMIGSAEPAAPSLTRVADTATEAAPHGGSAAASYDRRGWWRRQRGLTAATALAAGCVAAAMVVRDPPRDASAVVADRPLANTIVVLPFAVRGGAGVQYLSEGMVDLLGRNLHGVGELRSIEPSIVLTANGPTSPNAANPTTGAEMSHRVGAGLFVLGTVTEVGSRLHIGASVFSATDPAAPLASVAASGIADSVFSLVDSLTRAIVSGLHRTPGQRLDGVAAATTSSLPALRAFLEGQSHFRRTQFAEAVDAFQRAVMLDTTFALAYYRMSTAADFMSRSDLARDAADKAGRLASRLTPRDSALLEARRLWWRASLDEAERICRELVNAHPEDIEAWSLLGEILFHGNPMRGRSIAEARPAFERMLAARVDEKEALDHLARIAAALKEKGESLRLARIGFRLGVIPEDMRDSLTAWRLTSLEDSAYRQRAIADRRRGDVGAAHASASRVATLWQNLDAAREILQLLVEPAQPASVRAFGHVTLAELALANGRWRAAKRELTAAAPLHWLHGVEYDALLSSTLYLSPSREELATLRRELEGLRVPPSVPSEMDQLQPFDSSHIVLRQYLIGLVSARLGDTAATRQTSAELAELQRGSPATRQLAEALSHSLQALLAWQRGRPQETLAELEASRLETSLAMLVSPFGSRSWERYLHAEALRALGRDDEALGWYESMGQNRTYDLVYLAPALVRSGEILERKGRPAEAADRFAHARALWSQADPELRPIIETADVRLASLCRSRAPEVPACRPAQP
jgi:tetratricopeptide (TPR) repeat protein